VASSTLGYVTGTITDSFTHEQIHPEVEAYYNLSSPAPEVFFYRYYAKGGKADGEESGWEGPIKVDNGYVPRLAGGPAGLFMLSTDIAPGESLEAQPSEIDVRKFNETTKSFGEPTPIAKIPTSAGTLFNSGDIYENPETGYLYVAEPVIDSEGNYVMRLWESTDGGESFHGERNIATIGYAYLEVPRLAVAADGQGWLTFKDAGGLEVADLNALVGPTPPTPSPTPAATALATTQTSGTITGTTLTIPAGTLGETDRATVTGTNAASATGTVSYSLYSSSSCASATRVSSSSAAVTSGVAAPSEVTAALPPGAYYWEASYSGDANNLPSSSACGSEVLTVAGPPKSGGSGTSTESTVTVEVTCATFPCTITLTLTLTAPETVVVHAARAAKKKKNKAKTIILAKGTFTILGPKKLTLHLTKKGKQVFAAHHDRLKASLLLAEKLDGHTIQSLETIKIVPAKHKHKK
jgi:hypothetical protein